jgi:sorbitol/mannitol transport system substrate-binding protein
VYGICLRGKPGWGDNMAFITTTAASFITDPKQSKVADKVAFAQGPYSATQKGANRLRTWALAVPAGTQNADAAQKFIAWATSKEYIA